MGCQDSFSLVSLRKWMDQDVHTLFQTDPGAFVPSSWSVLISMDYILCSVFLRFDGNAVRHVAMWLVQSGQTSENDFFHWAHCLWRWQTKEEKIHLNLKRNLLLDDDRICLTLRCMTRQKYSNFLLTEAQSHCLYLEEACIPRQLQAFNSPNSLAL